MALKAYCPICQRTVYVQAEDTPVCPVCSTPLVDTLQPVDDGKEGAK